MFDAVFEAVQPDRTMANNVIEAIKCFMIFTLTILLAPHPLADLGELATPALSPEPPADLGVFPSEGWGQKALATRLATVTLPYFGCHSIEWRVLTHLDRDLLNAAPVRSLYVSSFSIATTSVSLPSMRFTHAARVG